MASSPTASETETPKAGNRYHHGNLRQALIDAAIEQIAEGGGAFQLRAVARRAGVSSAAPYRHFRGKSELLQAVAAEVAARLHSSTEAQVAASGAKTPIERFRAQGIAFVKFAVQHPAHFRVLNLPDVAARLEEELLAVTGGRDLLEDVIAESQEAGELNVMSPATIKLTAQALVYGLARLIVDGHLGEDGIEPEEAERAAEAVTGLLAVGLIPR